MNQELTEQNEFWIHKTGMAYNFDVMSDKQTIHVIRYSVHKAALKEIERLKTELETVIKIGVEGQREINRKLSAVNDKIRSENQMMKESLEYVIQGIERIPDNQFTVVNSLVIENASNCLSKLNKKNE